ncbi:MAG: pentapeptide repeat-containing protein [Desulfobacteraceae bacterium]|jgi:hypothetical protein
MSLAVGLRRRTIVWIVTGTLILITAVIYVSQLFIDNHVSTLSKKMDVISGLARNMKNIDSKEMMEISKIDAEISKIRSDTLGSLFWLKLIALFVTVGGAVGGYLIGHERATEARIKFEDRKNVDAVYQSIVQELSSDAAILRAAAAVKLGAIMQEFPHEWNVSNKRKHQLIQLTKQVLAAALSIEDEPKVLKTLTINIVLHKPQDGSSGDNLANARELDLSGAKAMDAYWAKTDFTYADFYKAVLSKASFRNSRLTGAQFRETVLTDTVFIGADCTDANFKMADLRGADFSQANLEKTMFNNAKLFGAKFKDLKSSNVENADVDISKEGDGSNMASIHDLLTDVEPDE